MKRSRKIYNGFQLVSSIFLILTLVWLTISIPYVYSSQLQLAESGSSLGVSGFHTGTDEEVPNPFGNSTEEKAPNNSLAEEYLHDHHASDFYFSIISQYYNCEDFDPYHAFHGELLVPPPNFG